MDLSYKGVHKLFVSLAENNEDKTVHKGSIFPKGRIK